MPSLPRDLKNLTRKPSEPVKLDPNPGPKQHDPRAYEPDDNLVAAIKVAMLLRKPLLVTGEPGTGKTDLGHYLAWKMAQIPCYQFNAKSTSAGRDVFYSYDSLRRFEAGGPSVTLDPRAFIHFDALGKAILNSRQELPPELVGVPKEIFQHEGPRQSVVVIDEIDKAPRDFPNDLLNEIDQGFFAIPEIGLNRIEADPEFMPILVITSNSEKTLPGAFLRRCVYYNIEFPKDKEERIEALNRIVSARLPDLGDASSPLVKDALDLFETLRDSGLDRKPATAELLDWLLTLTKMGALPEEDLRGRGRTFIQTTFAALIKGPDRESAEQILDKWLAPKTKNG